MMSPGTYFRCRPIDPLYPSTGLQRTREYREMQPDPHKMYIVCRDGSIQDAVDPKCPIGWELGDGWYRLAQVGFKPKKCEIIIRGTMDPAPDGKLYSREVAFEAASQNAHDDDSDFDDQGEEEVTSKLKT